MHNYVVVVVEIVSTSVLSSVIIVTSGHLYTGSAITWMTTAVTVCYKWFGILAHPLLSV